MTERQREQRDRRSDPARHPGPPVPRLRGPRRVRAARRAAAGDHPRARPAATPPRPRSRRCKAEEARRQRAAVAGFDLVFSPVKSAALLWALDERPQVRDAIRRAHEDAVAEALALVEEHAAFTRTGAGGIAQIGTQGLMAAAFEHWDSRAGDPNLHTHVAVSSKVCGTDGKWRSLDARALYRMTVAVSEAYNTAFEAHLTAALGVTFTARPDTDGRPGAGPRDRRRAVRDDQLLLPPPRRDRDPLRPAPRRLPRPARPRPARRGHPPARPAGQPGHPPGQEAAPVPGRTSGPRGARNWTSSSAPAPPPG